MTENGYDLMSYASNILSEITNNVENISFPMNEKEEAFDPSVCLGCGLQISERYIYELASPTKSQCKRERSTWHEACLCCVVCGRLLAEQEKCHEKNQKIYCQTHYSRKFGAKCAKCQRSIQPADWVRRAKDHVYHLACFACDNCKRQLSTGEDFAMESNRVLCKVHYMELLDGGPIKDLDTPQRPKTKRVRTTFTEEQLQVLQANFQLDSNPDGQDLERIAQMTGLSKRVTQVWFQNSRARQKKHQQKKSNGNGARSGSVVEGGTTSGGEMNSRSSSVNSNQSVGCIPLSETSLGTRGCNNLVQSWQDDFMTIDPFETAG